MEPTPPFFEPQDTDRISAVLGDPTRRAMYLHVKQRHSPLTVNDIAEHFGIHRNAAKFHLDKLLAAGLLRAEFRRVNGKRGPGAGRPSKLYSASD
ncbi:MAG TPA: helix-turn-helix domain-containing protein, partial [Actinomycetota bacterium]|nr:helix-turn-helix domain-containing protein [Actinomycetota bacterium]